MIIENMSNEDYHKREEISKSQLDLIAQSPSTFQWAKNLPRSTTKAFDFGEAGHAIILEPSRWESEYVLPLEIPRRSNAEKAEHAAFAEANADKIILDRKDYDMVLACRESIMAEPTARMIIEGSARTEVSFFNKDETTGMGQRCRLDLDFLERGIIADLKFIDKIENFSKHIHEYRYHVQDAHYKEVVAAEIQSVPDDLTFIFIVCGKAKNGGRHPVRVFELKENAKEIGMQLRNRDMAKYAECMASNNWIEISEIDLPGWVK
jgi:exodeoxyribonuclease VIII